MQNILCFLLMIMACTAGISQAKLSATHPHCGPKSETVEESRVFLVAQKMPKYPGGEQAVTQFITSHVQASKAVIQGHKPIAVSFVIDTTGQVVNVCINKSKSEPPPDLLTPLEQEVLRVVQLLPKWTPGKQGSKKVPVRITHLVKFN